MQRGPLYMCEANDDVPERIQISRWWDSICRFISAVTVAADKLNNFVSFLRCIKL